LAPWNISRFFSVKYDGARVSGMQHVTQLEFSNLSYAPAARALPMRLFADPSDDSQQVKSNDFLSRRYNNQIEFKFVFDLPPLTFNFKC
jgi:hypothetical protein